MTEQTGSSKPHISPDEIEKAVDIARGIRRDIDSLTPGTARDEYELYDGKLANAVLGLVEQLEALRAELAEGREYVGRNQMRDDAAAWYERNSNPASSPLE